jgi:hypothetical protein
VGSCADNLIKSLLLLCIFPVISFASQWDEATDLALALRPNSQIELLLQIEKDCWALGETPANPLVKPDQATLCALVEGELLLTPSLFYDGKRLSEWKRFFSLVPSPTPWQRAHLERTAPLIYRPNWRAALVAIEWALRVDASALPLYWKADTLHRQGNLASARPIDLQVDNSPEWKFRKRSCWRKPADGICRGLQPKLAADGWGGLGAGISSCGVWSDHVDNAWGLDVFASTRGNVWARGQVAEGERLFPYRLRLQAAGGSFEEDFFGAGLSNASVAQTFRSQRADVSLFLDIPFRDDAFGAFVSVGARTQLASVNFVGLPAPVDSTLGPALITGLDFADSAYYAKDGWRAILSQMLNVRVRTFLTQRLDAEWILPWTIRFRTRAAATAVVNWGDAFYHQWPTLGGAIPLAAVRPYRYVDKNLAAFSIGQEFDWLRSFSISTTLTQATSATTKWGGALSAVWFFSRDRRWLTRVDAGVFGGEWALQWAGDFPF